MTGYIIVTSTFPTQDSAKAAAKLLVEKRLAACVQLLPINSIYSWQGEVCDESEILLLIKSRTALFGEISAAIKENHTYEVPQIVQIPITDGLPEYLRWIEENTQITFNEKVFAAVRKIPAGKVASYSQVAIEAGSPRAARAVGNVLHTNISPENAPCHRVVHNDGRLAEAYVFGGAGKQEAMLKSEGVEFLANGRVNMKKCRYMQEIRGLTS